MVKDDEISSYMIKIRVDFEYKRCESVTMILCRADSLR